MSDSAAARSMRRSFWVDVFQEALPALLMDTDLLCEDAIGMAACCADKALEEFTTRFAEVGDKP